MNRVKRQMTEETKEKIRQANKGKTVSEETKAKMRTARANRVVSDETKEKIKQGLVKYWKNVIWITDTENKDVNTNLKNE